MPKWLLQEMEVLIVMKSIILIIPSLCIDEMIVQQLMLDINSTYATNLFYVDLLNPTIYIISRSIMILLLNYLQKQLQ